MSGVIYDGLLVVLSLKEHQTYKSFRSFHNFLLSTSNDTLSYPNFTNNFYKTITSFSVVLK